MKSQCTEGENIFTNDTSDKGLIFQIYKEFIVYKELIIYKEINIKI